MINPISNSKIHNYTCFEEINSPQELQYFVGKVVKYTNDSGKTWHYFLLNKCVNFHSPNDSEKNWLNLLVNKCVNFYSSDDQNQINGVLCSAEKKIWHNHLISTNIFFTKDAFRNEAGKPRAYFKRVFYSEFKHRSFAGVKGNGRLPEAAASNFIIQHPMSFAPLILVRSEKPTELKISILFNEIHTPQNPIAPSPSSVDKSGKYTWNVISQTNGSMISQDQKGVIQRIGLIWWESFRKINPPKINPEQAFCVKKSELKVFLYQYLQKMGVQEKESAAFTDYWNEVMTHEANVKKHDNVLIQPIQAKHIENYLPKLEVENNGDTSFNVNRFYFLFKTVSGARQGKSPESLQNLPNKNLGPNVVLDLGGEIIDRLPNGKCDSQPFNDKFIQKYIRLLA